MDRLGASRGIVASSPTAGRPSTSRRFFGLVGGGVTVSFAGASVNEIVDDAVYPPDLSTGFSRAVVSVDDRLIRRRRYLTSPTTSATTMRTAIAARAM